MLVIALPVAVAGPAEAVTARCSTKQARPNAGLAHAGNAVSRGLFVTYTDDKTARPGTLVPAPDLSGLLVQATVDRGGLATAIAGPAYSPRADGLVQAGWAKVQGHPPQERTVRTGGGACVRIADGPLAEAASNVWSLAPDLRVRHGELRAVAGPRGEASESSSSVVMTDVHIGGLHIEQIVLTVKALADGEFGFGETSSMIQGLTVGQDRYVIDLNAVDPTALPPPDAAALAAAGVEFLSGGTERHSGNGKIARATATGPVLRVRTPDGRTVTVVLGQASAVAKHATS